MHKFFLIIIILNQKKILWRMNFVLIKFSPNALLFEKMQNEWKNPSFLYKVTCIRSDHAGTVTMFHIHGFLLQEALFIQFLIISRSGTFFTEFYMLFTTRINQSPNFNIIDPQLCFSYFPIWFSDFRYGFQLRVTISFLNTYLKVW